MSSVCVDFCVKKSRLVTENTDVITMRAVDVTMKHGALLNRYTIWSMNINLKLFLSLMTLSHNIEFVHCRGQYTCKLLSLF